MLELYHNAASTCSQKVRLVLAEKGLEYKTHDIDLLGGAQHDSDYVKLNPNHVVPTLAHDGRVLIESTLINEYLEDAFPEPSLAPSTPAGRHAMRLWTKRIDTLHPNAGVITYGIGTRPMMLQLPKEEIEKRIAAIPDPVQRANRASVIEHGTKAPQMQTAVRNFVGMLDQLETSLEDGAWAAGDSFSLADAAILPYVMRLDHLAMTPAIEARPRVQDWYTRAQARPSYKSAISDQLPEPIVQLFRTNGEAVWAELEPLTRRSD